MSDSGTYEKPAFCTCPPKTLENPVLGNQPGCPVHDLNTFQLPLEGDVFQDLSLEQLLPQLEASMIEGAIELVCDTLKEDKNLFRKWQQEMNRCFQEAYYQRVRTGEEGFTFYLEKETINQIADKASVTFLNDLISTTSWKQP